MIPIEELNSLALQMPTEESHRLMTDFINCGVGDLEGLRELALQMLTEGSYQILRRFIN